MTDSLRIQQRELSEQLDELDEAIAELTVWLHAFSGDDDDDERVNQSERLAWLYRQQAGLRVILGETERALLTVTE